MKRYVVIGASAAGCNAIKEIRRLQPEDEIILISTDTAIYSRCILYHYLKGIRTLEQLNFMEADFETKYNIQWMKGRTAKGVCVEKNEVLLDDGTTVAYDELLIATGSHTNFPPIPGLREGTNILGFRNFDDVQKIEALLPKIQNIFVMGAGLVGIDVIAGLVPYHKNITLADMGPYMLPIQLDERASKTYIDLFAKEGVKQYYGMGAKEFKLDENNYCYEVELQDGTIVPVDLVINCAGVRSNVEFLADTGIECDRFGLIFDHKGQTNIPNIFGAGDVSGRAPIWPVAVKEGIIAANNMCGISMTMDDFFSSKSTMNFLGVPTLSVGNPNKYDETFSVEIDCDDKGNYKKIVHKDGIITGALIQGDLSYAGVLTQLIRRKVNVSKVKKPLFKIDYSDFFRMNENFEFTYEKEYIPE
ncbi:Nitrite reductase probable [NAD(P)H] subunit [Lachnospiraceae bacterium TWA4]|nr:Nitrite reductase probable [NAD(P)H] subunit [Lachnospiraceae bacterium TWA4]